MCQAQVLFKHNNFLISPQSVIEILLSIALAKNEMINVKTQYASMMKMKTSKGLAVRAATVFELPIRSLTVMENTTDEVSTRFMKLLVNGLNAKRKETGSTIYLKV